MNRFHLILIFLFFDKIVLLSCDEGLTIEECLFLAQTRNIDIIRDGLERRDAWRLLRMRLRSFLPKMAVSFSSSDSVVYGGNDSHLKHIGIEVSQMIFNGGRDLAAYRSSWRELELNDLEAELLVQKLRLQVSTLYINLLMYREILKIEEQSLKILQEQSAIAHTEYEIGSLRASDLIDIRINSTEYAMNIDETRIRIFESRYALANLMDLPVEELPPLNSVLNPDYRGIYPALLKSDSSLISLLTAEALGRSTELKSLEKQEIDLRQGLRESRTGWLPAVEAVGDLKFAGRDFPLNEPSFSLGLNLSFDTPLFPGTLSVNTGRSGRDERNRQLSADAGVLENPESLINPGIIRNRIQTMEMDIRMKRRELEYRTEILADRILQTARQCELEREKCLLEEEKLKVEEIQMSMGEITRLDYVESEIRLADSRRSLFESIAALFNAELELEYLCGRESGLYSEILLKNADNSSPGGEP